MSQGVRYRVHRKIASGGMAEIFLASQIGHEGFEKPVVLKRILPAMASDPGFIRMLLDEAHIVSGLSHTNLVQVLDLWRADGQCFLVLEFVDGWSLEQVRTRAAKARLKLPLHLSLSITSSLCRGLHYVHRHARDGQPLGIVHRDVNPQNVLLSREGDVKLADFGIAKAVGRREKSAIGVIKGKFAYMSPEQSVGADLDARSDLFSVGSLLYVLTTGRKPFGGKTDLDTLMQVRRARHLKPSVHVRDFNPDVERFIERALRADRARRWQTAEQMADRLDNILVKLGQPSGPAALRRWLSTLEARDGGVAPADPFEPGTSVMEPSSALDWEPLTHLQQLREDEDVETRMARVDEATQMLSELDLEEASAEDTPSGTVATTDPSTHTIALQISDLEEHTPPEPPRPRVEAPPVVPPPPFTPSAPVRESAPATSRSEAPPAFADTTPITPGALPTAISRANSSHPRTALVARLTSAARRTALVAVLLSLLLGSGVYIARPFLPDWIASTTVTRWFDHLFERLPDAKPDEHEEGDELPGAH